MEDTCACLETPQDQPPELKGSYAIFKLCYFHASSRQPNPSREDLAKISGEYDVLYQRKDHYLPGHPLPTHISPFQIEDGVLSEEVVEMAVHRIN